MVKQIIVRLIKYKFPDNGKNYFQNLEQLCCTPLELGMRVLLESAPFSLKTKTIAWDSPSTTRGFLFIV